MTANWQNTAGSQNGDWIGLYKVGREYSGSAYWYIYVYPTGSTSGTVTTSDTTNWYSYKAKTSGGPYEFVYVDTYGNILAISQAITVVPNNSPTPLPTMLPTRSSTSGKSCYLLIIRE